MRERDGAPRFRGARGPRRASGGAREPGRRRVRRVYAVSRRATGVALSVRRAREGEAGGRLRSSGARSPRRETDELDVPFAAVPGVKRARGTRPRPRRDATGQTAEALEALRALLPTRGPRTSARGRARAARHERRAQRHGTELTARGSNCVARRARGSGQSAHETPSTCAIERALFYRRCRSCSGETRRSILESFDASGGGGSFAADTRVSSFPSIGTPDGAATRGPDHGEEEEEEPRDGQEVQTPVLARAARGPRGETQRLRGALGAMKFDILGRKTRGVKGDALTGARRGHCEAQEHVAEGARCLGEGQRVRGPPVRGG